MTSVNPYKVSNMKNDYSNTPISYDGSDYNIGGFPTGLRLGFVIFIDALGIKGIWLQRDSNDVVATWKNIINQFIKSIEQHLNIYTHYVTAVSDTIIICCDCEINEINRVFDALLVPFRYSISNKFPLRGSISYGYYYLSNVLIIGSAIDEAASTHNEINMLGVFTTRSLSTILASKGFAENTGSMCIYRNIVTKSDPYDGYALKWYSNQDEKIKEYLQIQVDSQQNDEVKEKYRNTLNYCNYIDSLD